MLKQSRTLRLAHALPFLLTFTLTPLRAATQFADWLPENTTLLLLVNDVSRTKEVYKDSPLKEAVDSVDWDGVTEYVRMVAKLFEDEAPGFNTEEFMGNVSEFLDTTTKQMSAYNGQAVIAWGDFTEAMKASMQFVDEENAIEEEFTAIYMSEDEVDEKKEAELFERQRQLEERQNIALQHEIAKQIFIFADVDDDGGAWLKSINDEARATAARMEESNPDNALMIEEIEVEGLQVFRRVAKPKENDGENSEEDTLLAPDWEPHWTVSDGVYIVSLSEEAMRTALSWQQNGNANALSGSDTYADSLKRVGESDVLFFLNLPLVMTLFQSMVEAELEDDDIPAGELSPKVIFDWLGLDAIKPLSYAIKLEEDRLTSKLHMGFSRATGLSNILVQDHEGKEAPMPAFVHQDFPEVLASNWSLAKFYDDIKESMKELSPQVGMYFTMMEGMATAQIGINYRSGLLDHMGTGLVLITMEDKEVHRQQWEALQKNPGSTFSNKDIFEGTRALIAIELSNQKAFDANLQSMLKKLMQRDNLESQEYLGETIFLPMKGMGLPEAEQAACYAYIDDYLVFGFGDIQMLQKAIQAHQDSTQSLWETDRYQAARDKAPEAATSLYYSDFDKMSEALALSLKNGFYEGYYSSASEAPPAELMKFPSFGKLWGIISNSLSLTKQDGLDTVVESHSFFSEED